MPAHRYPIRFYGSHQRRSGCQDRRQYLTKAEESGQGFALGYPAVPSREMPKHRPSGRT